MPQNIWGRSLNDHHEFLAMTSVCLATLAKEYYDFGPTTGASRNTRHPVLCIKCNNTNEISSGVRSFLHLSVVKNVSLPKRLRPQKLNSNRRHLRSTLKWTGRERDVKRARRRSWNANRDRVLIRERNYTS